MRWDDLEPETRASIEMQPIVSSRKCGCFWRQNYRGEDGPWIYLCQYHQGFDDGVEKARPDLSDIESVIHQHCGSDSSDDTQNDWVHDLAVALFGPVGGDQ